jgi:hypothetical protein
MTHRWEQFDKNKRDAADMADWAKYDDAQEQLAALPRWRRIIPLIGRAADLRHVMACARRNVDTRADFYDESDYSEITAPPTHSSSL